MNQIEQMVNEYRKWLLRLYNGVMSVCEIEGKKHFNNYDEFEEKVYSIVKELYILSFNDEKVFVCNIIYDYYKHKE